jgi:hypothetical protein
MTDKELDEELEKIESLVKDAEKTGMNEQRMAYAQVAIAKALILMLKLDRYG